MDNTIDYAHQADLLFQRFLRHGQHWRARKLERDTEREVSASYVSALLKGKIRRPKDEILGKIADAMEFPSSLWQLHPEEWETELEWVSRKALQSRRDAGIPVSRTAGDLEKHEVQELLPEALGGREFADLLNYLFERAINERTGERYTEQQIAIRSDNVLVPDEVRVMRGGDSLRVGKGKLTVLCEAFEVSPEYWNNMSRKEARAAGIDRIKRYIISEGPDRECAVSWGDENAMVKFLDDLSSAMRHHGDHKLPLDERKSAC